MIVVNEKCFVKTLDCSTAHISKATADRLMLQKSLVDRADGDESPEYLPLIVYDKDEYGWFIKVPGKEDLDLSLVREELPGDLYLVLRYALESKCSWIVFDCDGADVEGLPKFDW